MVHLLFPSHPLFLDYGLADGLDLSLRDSSLSTGVEDREGREDRPSQAQRSRKDGAGLGHGRLTGKSLGQLWEGCASLKAVAATPCSTHAR